MESEGKPLPAGLRIVVVGVNFAPEPTGIGPYTTELCQQLSAAGASVHAVTGIPHYPAWSVPRSYQRKLFTDEHLGEVRVTRARHYVPRAQGAIRRALFEASFAASSFIAARRLNADVVLAVTPNLGALPVAAAVARRNEAPLGVIVQDLMGQAGQQSGIAGASVVAALGGSLEARWLHAADLVGVISTGFAEQLASAGINRSRIVSLPNYTHVSPRDIDQAEARAELGWPVDGFYAVHTGNMGLKQDLRNIIEAARLADRSANGAMRYVLVGDGSQRTALGRAGAGIRCLQFHSPLDEGRYPLALAAADVLLVNERSTVKDMSLPSKLTSYLAAGRPIVAAVRADGTTAHEVLRSGGGLVIEPGNPATLVKTLDSLRTKERLRLRIAERGRRFAESTLSRGDAEQRNLAFVSALIRGHENRSH